jgi:hypothetical protein
MTQSRWFFKIFFLIAVTTLLIMLARPSIPKEVEHRDHALHPCGMPGLDLQGITSYFLHRWKASYVDLKPEFIARYLEHIENTNEDIVLVRVFFSPHQNNVAVITAKRFVNYLDGKPLVDMYCVIKSSDDNIVREYDSRELEDIIREPGIGT